MFIDTEHQCNALVKIKLLDAYIVHRGEAIYGIMRTIVISRVHHNRDGDITSLQS